MERPPNPLPKSVKPPGLGPRKRANAAKDLHHWAKLCAAEVSPEARNLHKDPHLLMQAAIVARDAGRFREFHYPAFRARWAEARDISDPELVRGLLAGAGLEADSALERAASDEIRERLDADSRAAAERGVFGVPTLFVGDEMFWGNDRFELVHHYLVKALS